MDTRASRARRREHTAAHRPLTTIQQLYQHPVSAHPAASLRELYTDMIAHETRITQQKSHGVAICRRRVAITGSRTPRAGTFSPFGTTGTGRRFFRRAGFLPNPRVKLPVPAAEWPHFFPTQYRWVVVRRKSASPAIAGLAMKPISRASPRRFTATTSKLFPTGTTKVLPIWLQ
jgi:hypothetical protein